LVYCGLPCGLREREDRLSDPLIDRISKGKPDTTLATRKREVVACPSRVRAREDLSIQRALGQLLEREIQHAQMIRGVVGARIPRPQDPGEYLPAAG
jgi:hypothetical protein